MAIAPPEITPPPEAPIRTDRATFSGRVDAFVTWLIYAATAFSALAANAYTNAVAAFSSASAAFASASAAALSATNASAAAEGMGPRPKYYSGSPTLIMRPMTGGAGSRNVIQGHALDLPNKQYYALQLKESADSFYIRRIKFGNVDLPGNRVELEPLTPIVAHQGLFFEDVADVRYLYAGGEAGSAPSLIRVRESDGETVIMGFNPALTPGAAAAPWGGNITPCLDITKTKLVLRVDKGSAGWIFIYDWAGFKANSATAVALKFFVIDPAQYAGTSLQGVAADEDTVYVLSGNTVQNLAKYLYAYSYIGVIQWKRVMAPQFFESFKNGTKCEVEGLDLVQLPTGQRMMTLMTEQGTPAKNIHMLYAIPQYPEEAFSGEGIIGLYFNDYGGIGVGGRPHDSLRWQTRNETVPAENTRSGVWNSACVGPTGGGLQLIVGPAGEAVLANRENTPLEFWTNNLKRMALANDRARLDIGLGESGPQPGGVSPGYRLGLSIGALSVLDGPVVEQEIMRAGWVEGSQDLGAGEGIESVMGCTLAGQAFSPLAAWGISKVTNSDSTTNSHAYLKVSPGTGQTPVKFFNFQSSGTFTPLADNTQAIGDVATRWAALYVKDIRRGAGTTIGTSCTGTPEGQVTAPVGSDCNRIDGTTGTRVYWKATGTGNTGWVAICNYSAAKQLARSDHQ